MLFTVPQSGYGRRMTGRKRQMDDLQGEIQELFADLWQVPGFAGMRRGFRPQCDCFRTDDPPTLHVVVELAGVDPESVEVVASGQTLLIAGVRERRKVGGDRLLVLVTVRDTEADVPTFDDLYEVGTAAIVHKMIRVPDGTLRILVQGLRRVRLERRVLEEPYLVAEFLELPDLLEETKEVEALTRNVQGLFAQIIALAPYLPEELQIAAANLHDP